MEDTDEAIHEGEKVFLHDTLQLLVDTLYRQRGHFQKVWIEEIQCSAETGPYRIQLEFDWRIRLPAIEKEILTRIRDAFPLFEITEHTSSV